MGYAQQELCAINVLLRIERREHDWLVMHFGSVLVNCSSGLGAKVAIARIEVEGAHMVSAVRAGKLHAALDARDAVEAFHNFECSPLAGKRKARGVGSQGNEG
jgi:hypothetical protein